MGIRRRAQKIKGTARPSGGEKRLIKQLYVADKNRQQEKLRKYRMLLKTEKAAAKHGPNSRAHVAFHNFLKRRARNVPKFFEVKEDDEPVTISIMLQSDWPQILLRKEQILKDITDMKMLSTNARRSSPPGAIQVMNAIVSRRRALKGHRDQLPLLFFKKNTRVQFYHRRRQCWYDQVLSSDSTTIPIPNPTPTHVVSEPVVCTPTIEEMERHAQVSLTCAVCQLPVRSDEMTLLTWVPCSTNVKYQWFNSFVMNSSWGTKMGDGANLATSGTVTCTSGDGAKATKAQVAHIACAEIQNHACLQGSRKDKRLHIQDIFIR
jgi:hypothetical protein